MRTIAKLAAAISCTAMTLACAGNSESPTGPLSPSSLRASSSASGPVTRPAGGRCATSISFVPARAGYAASLYITGHCQLKHLGRTSIVILQDFAFDGSIVNSTTHTAANGDVLNSTWYSAPGESTFDGTNAVFAGIETYVGGTGRFAHASGASRVDGTAYLNAANGTFTGQYTSHGTITY